MTFGDYFRLKQKGSGLSITTGGLCGSVFFGAPSVFLLDQLMQEGFVFAFY